MEMYNRSLGLLFGDVPKSITFKNRLWRLMYFAVIYQGITYYETFKISVLVDFITYLFAFQLLVNNF